MIDTIWDSVLHIVSEWQETVSKGKLLLEHNNKSITQCIFTLNECIVKLKWHEHTLYSPIIKDPRKSTVLCYLETLLPMYTHEFDLKACIASQYSGSSDKRKLIIYTWITEPHIDDSFISSLPKSINPI